MLDSRIRRLLDAYPAIFIACHRRHLREDESGKTITEHQASVLDHLHPMRPTTLSKLAEHMGVGPIHYEHHGSASCGAWLYRVPA
jgi:hypothetical protein